MTEWLEDWGEDVSDTGMMGWVGADDMEHGDMGGDTDGNSGMMSHEDMDELGQPPLRYLDWSCAHESGPHSDRKGRFIAATWGIARI